MLSMKDLYWLAGWLEGEGTFYINKGSINITVGSTDCDVVERAACIFGSKVRGPFKLGTFGYKPMFRTTVTKNAAGWMMTLYPLMGIRRQNKIRECLSYWRNKPSVSAEMKRRWREGIFHVPTKRDSRGRILPAA